MYVAIAAIATMKGAARPQPTVRRRQGGRGTVVRLVPERVKSDGVGGDSGLDLEVPV